MTTIPLVPPLTLSHEPQPDTDRPGNTPETGLAFDWEALRSAHTRTEDARAGFEKMVELAEPAFRPTAERFLELHSRHAGDIARMLADSGEAADSAGSVMGSVNRAVVATRAFFDDIDADLLAQIHSGEAHVLSAYDAALQSPLPRAVLDRLSDMATELRGLLAATPPKG